MEELFEKISAHYIKGMMVHDELTNYYDFLNLRGYKRFHEYQFICDAKTYRKINRYYINHHSRLIPKMKIDDPGIIPDNWLRYKRDEVDMSTKRNAIETGVNKWIEWERETKEMLENSIKELIENGSIADACFIKKLLHKVNNELKYAERKKIELQNVNFNIDYIMQEQESIHNKFEVKYEHK